ncbi:rubredoxin [bacterium]|nr:rubredoxin [bacterium]
MTESKNPFGPKFHCLKCSYIYDPAVGCPVKGVPPGTPFRELPDGFECPQCGADLTQFERLDRWMDRTRRGG